MSEIHQHFLGLHWEENHLNKEKGDNVNKSELIDAVAASADLPKAAAGRAIDAMIDAITDSLKKEDPVVLVGLELLPPSIERLEQVVTPKLVPQFK